MRRDAAQNRAALLATARAMTAAGDEPALNELARRAGVGVATVYRHFPDPTALKIALLEAPLAELGEVLRKASEEADPKKALRLLFEDVLALEMKHPLIASLVHAPHPEVADSFATLQASAGDIVRRAKRAKVVRANVTADDVCRLLLGVHAAASAGAAPDEAARRYTKIVLAGLSA